MRSAFNSLNNHYLTTDLDIDSIYFGSGASSISILIISNIDWTATKDSGFISLNKTSGNGNSMITISVQQNFLDNARFGIVQIKNTTLGITRTITIGQDGTDESAAP